MKKYKIIALTLSLLLLTGCSAKVNQISFSERKNQSYVIAEKDEEPEDLSLEDVVQEAAAQNDKTEDMELSFDAVEYLNGIAQEIIAEEWDAPEMAKIMLAHDLPWTILNL